MSIAPRRARVVPAVVLAFAVLPAAADVVLLKDGKKVEGEVEDKGGAYEVRTKFGSLTITKGDVQDVVKSPDGMVREAEAARAKAKALVDEAAGTESSGRAALLHRAEDEYLKAVGLYRKARDLFSGENYAHLDTALDAVSQDLGRCRENLAVRRPAPEAAPAPKAAEASASAPVAAAPLSASADGSFQAPKVPAAAGKRDGKDGDVLSFDVPPPPKAKTTASLLDDLKAPEPKARWEALRGLFDAKDAKTPEAAQAVGEALYREEQKDLVWGFAAFLTTYPPPVALKALRRSGEDEKKPEHRHAVVAAVRKTGGPEPVKWLIDTFLLKRDPDFLWEVASTLKKYKEIAVPEVVKDLRELVAKNKDPLVQVDLIKVLGALGEADKAAPLLVQLLGSPAHLRNAVVALQKIGRPAIPALINGLAGGPEVRKWCGYLLRSMTGQPWTSSNATEWTRWWNENEASIRADYARREKQDQETDWRLPGGVLEGYDAPLADAGDVTDPGSGESNPPPGGWKPGPGGWRPGPGGFKGGPRR